MTLTQKIILPALVSALTFVSQPGAANSSAETAVNQLRASAGHAPLRYSRKLEKIAERHARDMARQGAMTHQSTDGSGPAERALRAGYTWCRISENIAWGHNDLTHVIKDWYASPKHRQNMLNGQLQEFGVAKADGNYWVMVIARPGCEKAARRSTRTQTAQSGLSSR